jgi:hypothetical protein
LFWGGFYVKLDCEDWGDGCIGASFHRHDDREDLWILRYSTNQWWLAEDHAEGIGWREFFLGLMLHTKMMGELNWCWAANSRDFSFGSIFVAWFLERVPMLHPRFLVEAAGAWEPRLMRCESILVRHGGGEGGHYFMADMTHVWHQMPQIIMQFPYGGMDYHQDPDMVLPPGEAWDHRGMLMYFLFCDFDNITYVLCMDGC